VRQRLKTFLMLSSVLLGASVAWQLWSHQSHAEERAAWSEVGDSLRVQKAQIDSLEAILAGSDARVEQAKEELAAAQRRLTHYERQADGGRLPNHQYRQYMETIEAHNTIVGRHNADVARMQRLYRDYSALVDAHSALVDSANAMQRRATQEGYALPEIGHAP
jgi:septal ring factor EnvC (AmiA/AmiB activator)